MKLWCFAVISLATIETTTSYLETLKPVITANFDSRINLNYSMFYSFVFMLNVSDINNPFRNVCNQQITFRFRTLRYTNNSNIIKPLLLIIKITAIKYEINVNEKIRLIVDVMDYDLNVENMVYKWTEINGLLTNEDLINCKQSDDIS